MVVADEDYYVASEKKSIAIPMLSNLNPKKRQFLLVQPLNFYLLKQKKKTLEKEGRPWQIKK